MNRFVALIAVFGLIAASALAAPPKNIAAGQVDSILAAPLPGDAEKQQPLMTPVPDRKSGGHFVVPAQCCKVCSKGKPCGNSCIARSRTCNQPPGCAC